MASQQLILTDQLADRIETIENGIQSLKIEIGKLKKENEYIKRYIKEKRNGTNGIR
jgi:hypothetical protein